MIHNLRNRLIIFPRQGRLLICADLHGNKRDYLRMVELFRQERQKNNLTFLLFLGDLVHGPQHPDQVSGIFPFYPDESTFIVDHFLQLSRHFAGRVYSLLGNHEHGHVGGPHTFKYDADEVSVLETMAGPQRAQLYRQFFATWPLAALLPAGIVCTHGAPTSSFSRIEELLHVDYRGYLHRPISEMYRIPVLDLLWLRGSTDATVQHMLSVFKETRITPSLVVYGHDVVAEGFSREGTHHCILSSSFGLWDNNKYYLEIDLAQRYSTTHDLHLGIELKRLWPS